MTDQQAALQPSWWNFRARRDARLLRRAMRIVANHIQVEYYDRSIMGVDPARSDSETITYAITQGVRVRTSEEWNAVAKQVTEQHRVRYMTHLRNGGLDA